MPLRDNRMFYTQHHREERDAINNHTTLLERFGSNIKCLRKRRKYTQTMVANELRDKDIKIRRDNLSQIEAGLVKSISSLRLIEYANYYKTNLDYLLFYDLEKHPALHYTENNHQKLLDTLGSNIRYLRSRKRYSMTMVANDLRDRGVIVSCDILSQLERGRLKSINSRRLIDLANYYKVKLEDLLFYKTEDMFI